MVKVLSLPDRDLYTALSIGLARRLYCILGGRAESRTPYGEDMEPHYVWHIATTDFENGCDLVWRIGIAHLKSHGDDVTGYDYWALEREAFGAVYKFYKPSEIHRSVERGLPPIAPSLDELTEAYFTMACDYGPQDGFLYYGREPFRAQAEYEPELVAFCRAGLAAKTLSGFQWTPKGCELIIKLGYMKPDGRTHKEAEADQMRDQVRAKLATLSSLERMRLKRAAKTHPFIGFAGYLRERQHAGLMSRWHKGDIVPSSPELYGLDIPFIQIVHAELTR